MIDLTKSPIAVTVPNSHKRQSKIYMANTAVSLFIETASAPLNSDDKFISFERTVMDTRIKVIQIMKTKWEEFLAYESKSIEIIDTLMIEKQKDAFTDGGTRNFLL